MTYMCETKEQPTQPTLSVRVRAPMQELPQVMGRAYGEIAQYLCELGEQPAGPPFAAYYNLDVQDLDVEIGMPVSKNLPGKGNVQPSAMPGGKYAACLHTGPYSDIGPAYNTLSHWVLENGHIPTGVAYELYLNDPARTLPAELRTQILFPLR